MPPQIHPSVKNPKDINTTIVFTEKNHMAFFNTGKNIAVQKIEKNVNLYNITVENTHTYFANDILVHNKGGEDGGDDLE